MLSKAELIQKIKVKAKSLLASRSKSWKEIGRPEQQMPGRFFIWMILAGRGFGKTRAGSEAIVQLIQSGYKNICIMGETMLDTRKIMVEGESGIIKACHEKPKYYPSKHYIEWPNGAKVHLFSAEQPDSIRGHQFDAAWIDELAKFFNPEGCWKQIMMSVRLGSPKIIITTTPRPIPIIKNLVKNKNVTLTKGTTFANQANLSKEFIERLSTEYSNTKFSQQEIYGEIIEENSYKLWNIINYQSHPPLKEIVIAIDPAVTNTQASDETGIIVAGKCKEGKYYIIKDHSGKFHTSDWPAIAVDLYKKYNASKIVVEVNQGGDLVEELIKQIDSQVCVENVRAIKNKFFRAQIAASLYEQGVVFHCERFEELEEQMLNFFSYPSSPDRVDALVWALIYLKRPTYISQIL